MRTGCSHVLAALVATLAFTLPAAAQYPDHTLKFVVGFPAGGSPDTFLRNFTQRLTPLAGQPVIVENRPGANAMVAAQSVATSKPDGHTILFGPDSTPVGNIYLFKQLTYNPEKDFAPIAPMVWNTFVLVINPQRTQANTVGELTAQIKSKGGKAHYGITNSGAQLMGEL